MMLEKSYVFLRLTIDVDLRPDTRIQTAIPAKGNDIRYQKRTNGPHAGEEPL
ncbi:MAG TPA: hypothetical protein VIB07_03655 [Nitrososphaera sp.]|jgi:hypothetical protein